MRDEANKTAPCAIPLAQRGNTKHFFKDTMHHNINTDDLKRYIAGKEFELAKQLGILVEGIGKEHHQYCPFCPKESQKSGERFYIRTGDKTSFHCRQCFTGDLLALVMKSRCVDFNTAKQQVANVAGYINGVAHISQPLNEAKKAVQEGKPIPFLDTWRLDADSPIYKATATHRPDILLEDYQRAGAKLFRTGITIPMFDINGIESGWVRYFIDGGKPKLLGKSGIVGVDAIYNLRVAQQVKIVFLTAGVSDYLVLSGVIERLGLDSDYYAFTNGAGEGERLEKFEALLRPALTGLSVGIIQDNDEVGAKHARQRAEVIAKYAADVRIVKLPPVIFDCPVKDLRDFLSIDGTTFTDLLF